MAEWAEYLNGGLGIEERGGDEGVLGAGLDGHVDNDAHRLVFSRNDRRELGEYGQRGKDVKRSKETRPIQKREGVGR